jgi:hypothetical protein
VTSAPTNDLCLSTVLFAVPLAVLLSVIGGAICIAIAFGGGSSCTSSQSTGSVKGVPAKLVPIYQQAGVKYGLGIDGPSILAAINFVETGFGTNLGPSSAGAIGWMQFEPATWDAFGVDGDGDGIKDPANPWDAIFAAARLLRASGAPKDWHGAIFSYNHADWYVAEVLEDAKKYAGVGSIEASAGCEIGLPNDRIARMVAEADRLSRIRPSTEYVWGGSHTLSPTPANGPFDCSSAVSHLLQVGGFKNPTMDTVGLSQWGEPGSGEWVTVLVKPYEPEAHTVIEFMPGVTPPEHRYWGTSGLVQPGHGPGWIPESVFDASYLSRFEERHPVGV